MPGTVYYNVLSWVPNVLSERALHLHIMGHLLCLNSTAVYWLVIHQCCLLLYYTLPLAPVVKGL